MSDEKNQGGQKALFKIMQVAALSSPVSTTAQVKEQWDHPKTLRFDRRKTWLLVIIVGIADDQYTWTASLRLKYNNRPLLKAVELWTKEEMNRAKEILTQALSSVGKDKTQLLTKAVNHVRFEKQLDAAEFNHIVTPALIMTAPLSKNGHDKTGPIEDFRSSPGETAGH